MEVMCHWQVNIIGGWTTLQPLPDGMQDILLWDMEVTVKQYQFVSHIMCRVYHKAW